MNAVSNKYQPTEAPSQPPQKRKQAILLFFLMVTILGFYTHWEELDFLSLDAEGNVELSPQRQQELEERLNRLNRASQYVLRAARDGNFPCYNCGQDSLIFLYKGEVWKYGVTYAERRYRNAWLERMNLLYQTEYRGTVEECLIQEAYKIYNYAILPENVKRATPLIRPPGNKVDR
jgi:hypothetical protein